MWEADPSKDLFCDSAQGAPDVEKTDQEEDEQGEVAHGRGSEVGFRV